MVQLRSCRGRSNAYFKSMHHLSVTISLSYKDIYVNSFFPRTTSGILCLLNVFLCNKNSEMFQDKRMQETKKNIQYITNCCLGNIFGTAGRLQQIQKINQPIKCKSFAEEPVVSTSPYQTHGNNATESSTVGYVISERHWKNTFDFTEIVSNYGLK